VFDFLACKQAPNYEKFYAMTSSSLSPHSAEWLAKLLLARTSGIGPVSFRKLMRLRASACDIVSDWDTLGMKLPKLAAADSVMRELDVLHKNGGTLMLHGDETYPKFLTELPDAPLVLSVLGDVNALHARQVAIVGNRNASAAGMSWSKQLASEIARAGIVITSGLARGIDTAAHEGALSVGGQTVAVVAGGVDHIYPPENAKLREAIIRNGCVVSEQPWGMRPTASLFPRRNRINAGLSIGVVVSEATRHSGSLITAECALDYNREVWAVPGSPADPRSGGPNWLLKNGATLIENAADILQDLPSTPAPYAPKVVQTSLFDAPDDDAPIVAKVTHDVTSHETNLTPSQNVFGLLSSVGINFDDLIRQTGLDEAGLSGMLIELELDGHAVREVDGRWRRA
jgi:DNA processing protein